MKPHFGKIVVTALCLVTACLLMAGCAHVGPPRPPSLELPKPVADLRANRKGSQVTLSWTQPTLTSDRLPLRYLGPTQVCRNFRSEMTACQNVAGILPAPPFVAQRARKRSGRPKSPPPPPVVQSHTDVLPSDWLQQDPSIDVIYAVEVLNRNDRSAGLSDLVHVPALATLPPPTDLSAELSGDGVNLTWTSTLEPQTTLSNDSAKSKNVQYRYRIYRRDEGSGGDAVAGDVAADKPGLVHFTDSSFEWEKTYSYRIAAVSVVKRGDSEVQIEGDDSSPVRVIAHDVFPPAVPAGLQAAYSGEGQKPFIDLIWAPVTTADLAGYNVYRSESNAAGETKEPEAKQAMIKLNSDLVKSPSYRDLTVKPGRVYNYAVSTVDVRGNESEKSEPASEPVP